MKATSKSIPTMNEKVDRGTAELSEWSGTQPLRRSPVPVVQDRSTALYEAQSLVFDAAAEAAQRELLLSDLNGSAATVSFFTTTPRNGAERCLSSFAPPAWRVFSRSQS